MERRSVILLAIVFMLLLSACGVDPKSSGESGASIKITVQGEVFTATLYDNETAEAFLKKLPMTVTMNELNGNEKFYYLSDALPSNPQTVGSVESGEIMLYGNRCLVMFYQGFPTSYSYTRLGKVDNVSSLTGALGSGSTQVKFQLADEETLPREPNQPPQPELPNRPSLPIEPGLPPEIDAPNQPTLPDKPPGEQQTTDSVFLTVSGNRLEIELAKNASTDGLVSILKRGDVSFFLSDYGGFEKVGNIGHTLVTNHSQISAEPGDVMLYGNNNIVIFYGSNSWSYTRIGKINGYTASQLHVLLGAGNAQASISLKDK